MATPLSSINSYVREDFQMPETYDEAKLYLREYLRDIVQAVNARDIAQYAESEVVNGQLFLTSGDNNSYRQVYRKVIDFGALPNTTTKSVAHGITVTATTEFTRIYATASDPSTRFVPITYVNVTTPADGIEIDVDGTNVNIETTTANWTGFTTCYVVVEYVQT